LLIDSSSPALLRVDLREREMMGLFMIIFKLISRILENEGRAAVSVEQVSSLLPHPVARDDRLSGRAARAAARAGRMLLRFVEGRPVSLVTCAFLA
jgi:hypothetical protein